MPQDPSSHSRRVAPHRSRIRRRSRWRIWAVWSRPSSGPDCSALLACRRLSLKSRSLMDHRPFENTAKSSLGVTQPRLYGPDLATGDGRDVFVCHVLQKPEHENLSMLQGEFIQRLMDALPILRGKVRLLGAWVGYLLGLLNRAERQSSLA